MSVDRGTEAKTNTADNVLTDLSSLSSQGSTNTSHAAHLHALSAAHSLPDTDSATPPELRSPVGTAAWTQELADQVTWMTQQGQETASLRLSPEHLGPLEIRISMNDDKASVWFGAANADTRSALDQSLPRLREMFASQGMVLADSGVFKEAPRQQYKASFNANARPSAEIGEAAPVTQVAAARLRLIDTYV